MVERALGITALLVALSCSQGGGCDGCGGTVVPYPNPAPPGGAVQSDVVHAQLTGHMLTFLRNQIATLLTQYFTVQGTQAVYLLDETMFDPSVDPLFIRDGCIGEPDAPCAARAAGSPQEVGPTRVSQVTFDIAELTQALELTWLDADASGQPGLRFALNDFGIGLDLTMVTNIQALGSAACWLHNQTGAATGVRVSELSFELRFGLDNSGPAPLLTSRVDQVKLLLPNDDSAVTLAVTPCDGVADASCDDPRCHGAWGPYPATDCNDVCGVFDLFAQLGGFFVSILGPALNQLAPTLADTVSQSLMQSLGSAPLGVETEVSPATFVPLFAATQPLNMKFMAGQLSVAGSGPGRGLSFSLDGGSTASSPALCALGATPPDLAALVGPPPESTGFVEVFDPTTQTSHFAPYQMSFAVSEAMLAQALWAAFQAGLACLRLDGADMETLSGGKISLTAGTLMNFDLRLAGLTSDDAPIALGIWATRSPTVRLGAGRPIAPGVDDPLIEAVFDDVELSLYMMLDDNLVRISAVSADLVLRLEVGRAPDQTLELVVNDLSLVDARPTYREVVPEADLSGMFSFVIDVLIVQFLGDTLRFPLDVSGLSSGLGMPVNVRLSALRSDQGPTGSRYLSIYATLCDDNQIQDPNNLACYSPVAQSVRGATSLAVRLADETSLYVPADPERFASDRWLAAPSGRAKLSVAAGPLAEAVYGYQFRVDGGAWSSFRPAPAGELWVDSPRLLLVGLHHLEVRAQAAGEPRTRSAIESLDTWVDRERPVLRAYRNADSVWVEAEDLGSRDAVEVWARFSEGSGDWQAVSGPIKLAHRSGQLDLLARDLAGNTASLNLTLSPAVDAVPETASDGEGGCNAAGAPSLWLSLLLLLSRSATAAISRSAPGRRRRR